MERWAKVLARPELQRFAEAASYYEHAAFKAESPAAAAMILSRPVAGGACKSPLLLASHHYCTQCDPMRFNATQCDPMRMASMRPNVTQCNPPCGPGEWVEGHRGGAMSRRAWGLPEMQCLECSRQTTRSTPHLLAVARCMGPACLRRQPAAPPEH